MTFASLTGRRALAAAGVALALAAAGAVRIAVGSDHQDTPLVELNAEQDMTDVYAFPGSAPGRIALVLNSRAFLTPAQTAEIAAVKAVIYDAFKAAVAAGVAKKSAGILVDEQFGAAILRDATREGYVTACPAEKSGQDEFDFQYGEDFGGSERTGATHGAAEPAVDGEPEPEPERELRDDVGA